MYESESWGVHVLVACVCACVRERGSEDTQTNIYSLNKSEQIRINRTKTIYNPFKHNFSLTPTNFDSDSHLPLFGAKASNSSKNTIHGFPMDRARKNRSRTAFSLAPIYLFNSSGPERISNMEVEEDN